MMVCEKGRSSKSNDFEDDSGGGNDFEAIVTKNRKIGRSDLDKEHLDEVHEELPDYDPLKLKAIGAKDLDVLSCTLQDSIVPVNAISYVKDEGQFKILANRFCWEVDDPENLGHRVHAGISFSNVQSVRQKGIDLENPDEMLTLLTMSYDKDVIHLVFAGGKLIDIKVDNLECYVADLDAPYPTHCVPDHEKL
jgi:hypothetical protein